jgi:hypothetical protein
MHSSCGTFYAIDLCPAQPPQVITGQYVRGTQVGYNECNSTTENQQSMCQTIIVNSMFGAFSLKPSLRDLG